MAIQYESELYLPIKDFFQHKGYEVKGEVRHCDLVAIHPHSQDMIIVEMKKTFNLSLLLQGLERARSSEKIYLAVERKQASRSSTKIRWHQIIYLCKQLGLGLITVTFYKRKAPFVEIMNEPDSIIKVKKRKAAAKLRKEFSLRSGDYNEGGSTRVKQMTAYRERALYCAWQLKQLGQASPANLKALTGYGQTGLLLQKNYYGWFNKVKRGVYSLSPEGEQALVTYDAIIKKITHS